MIYKSEIGNFNIKCEDEAKAKKQLDEYFSGKRRKFDLNFKLDGTKFQKKVLKEMMKIPYGKTISYAELAKRAGSPRAYRAAASVCRKNDFPIVIPCHRVVGSNGLGGYSGGLEKKKWLLKLEKN